jgi:hypothetical protein
VLPAERGDCVNPYTAIVWGQAPLGRNCFGPEHPLERGIERTFFDLKQVAGQLLDVLYQCITVRRTAPENLKDHHLQRTGEKITFGIIQYLFTLGLE